MPFVVEKFQPAARPADNSYGITGSGKQKSGPGNARGPEKISAVIRFSDPALQVNEKGDKGKAECILATRFMKSHAYSHTLDASVRLQAPVRAWNVGTVSFQRQRRVQPGC